MNKCVFCGKVSTGVIVLSNINISQTGICEDCLKELKKQLGKVG